MRLSDIQIKGIVAACKKCFGEDARIWLFGSQVDDQAVGGDIDLYIETDLKDVMDAKLDMYDALRDVFGNRKVDLITHKRHRPERPIGAIAKDQGVELLDI